MARTVRTRDVTPKAGKWPNILNATVPGLLNVQVARVIASFGDREEPIAIIFPPVGQSVDRDATVEGVRARVKDCSLAYVERSDMGVVRLWIADSYDQDVVFLIAAAGATLQRSWAWDESPSIVVDAGNRSFRFEVDFSGDGVHDLSLIHI